MPVDTQCKSSSPNWFYLALQLLSSRLHCGSLQCEVRCGPLPWYLLSLNESLLMRPSNLYLRLKRTKTFYFPKCSSCQTIAQKADSSWCVWKDVAENAETKSLRDYADMVFCRWRWACFVLFPSQLGNCFTVSWSWASATTQLRVQKLLVSTMRRKK